METLLVLVPLDLFECELQQFGANAKDIALDGAYAGMAVLLMVVAWFAVRTVNGWLMLLVGLALWLVTMLVVMPLTGAGLFASGMLVSPLLTNAAFLCVFGGYAVVLAIGTGVLTWLAPGRYNAPQHPAGLERRSLLAGLGGTAALDPGTLVVYQMNGQVLPRQHGYPARLLVPGRYGMKDPKWLVGIRALDEPYVDWYQQRGWTRDGIVKTMSRIDLPANGAALLPGQQRVAGVAYAGDRGISQVEVSADGGATWHTASILEPPAGPDTMVRWESAFQIGSAPLTLVVRATDGTGVVQSEDFGLPAPDGSWGQDSLTVQPA
jgi:Oxidoreductase molybdopterin binding domain/Mo-co oxidoreductase dimerisation domain